jgi:TRAP-type C4-dicarboxylate transport system substrate-binding protein
VWVLTDKWYQALTQAEKEIILDAAKTALMAGRGLNRIIESSDKGLPVIAKKMEVYTPTSEEISQFRKLSVAGAQKIISEKLGEEGKSWTDKFLKAIEAAEKKAMTQVK